MNFFFQNEYFQIILAYVQDSRKEGLQILDGCLSSKDTCKSQQGECHQHGPCLLSCQTCPGDLPAVVLWLHSATQRPSVPIHQCQREAKSGVCKCVGCFLSALLSYNFKYNSLILSMHFKEFQCIYTVIQPLPQSNFRTFSLLPKEISCPLIITPSSHPYPWQPLIYSLLVQICLFGALHINGIVLCVFFCVWLLSPSPHFLLS